MEQIDEKKIRLNGLTLHTITTKKFKTNGIVLKIKAPLLEDTVTTRSLLPHVLESGTQSYPTATKLRGRLEELYGAVLSSEVAKKGENHIITLRMDIANEKFLSTNEPLLEQGVQLLAEVLQHPALEDGAFNNKIVEQEKRSLKQRIQSIYDDKLRYANMRLVEEMCQHEPYRLNVHGNIDEVDSISAESLYETYEHMLHNDEIDLYFIGDLEENQAETLTEKYFKLPIQQSRTANKTNVTHFISHEEQEIIEEHDVKQGKLHIGYRTEITYSDKDYYALQLFNGLFGGFSHSKLFINVREKASLAYYAASRIESHKGLIFVMSGIESKEYDKALSIIREQMEEMKQGNFTDDEIAQTKAVLKNQLLEMMDTAHGFIEMAYQNVLGGIQRTPQQWIDGIERVTREELIKVGETIHIDTIYFLKGTEGA
ncbi:EF-P 5-aminopentanol modification-associated protein YfmF [Bacillus solimangrovi]|uniref:Zinc protease n=1 Tax=Bacillus solimangrovi TaxID=1305675 RepID=A0A1E5LJ93_9BACI|nr:pitrilysin family protein [Bacillus solimangrovi]OEH94145.1 zinc protease [Bacillus solimangrovi]